MNKLNVFAARYPEESENRLTWALMSLLRLAPMARVAFVDLVRAQQEEPIPALSEMLGCETRIDTQDSGIVAESGRLTAVGITSEAKRERPSSPAPAGRSTTGSSLSHCRKGLSVEFPIRNP